jgi:acetyltransferase-like isoleucine patch superfamily enzyme
MVIIDLLKNLRTEYLRKVVYRKYKIDKGLFIGRRTRIWARDKVEIGRNFYMGKDSLIECDVVIGDNVMWGSKVAVIGRYDHHYQQVGTPTRLAMQMIDADYNWKGLGVITIIENDVWVGYGSTILAGIKVGEGSIIGAGSLVTRDVEPYSIYAGAPAKKMRSRFDTAEDLKRHLELVKSKYQGLL